MKRLKRRLQAALLDRYKRSKRGRSDESIAHCLDVAVRTVQRTAYAFLITQSATGAPSARLVEPLFDDGDWTFWIGTHPAARKVQEVHLNPSVTLAFGNQQERANVVFSGNIEIETDLALRQRHFKPAWRLFFPSGPAGADFVLLKLSVRRMELMSFHGDVVPEPFGLRPMRLERKDFGWVVQED